LRDSWKRLGGCWSAEANGSDRLEKEKEELVVEEEEVGSRAWGMNYLQLIH